MFAFFRPQNHLSSPKMKSLPEPLGCCYCSVAIEFPGKTAQTVKTKGVKTHFTSVKVFWFKNLVKYMNNPNFIFILLKVYY